MSVHPIESYMCSSPTVKHLNIPDLSYRQLKAIILFQEIYKLKRQTVLNINKTLNIIYRTLVSVSNNLNTNYISNVVSLEQYSKYMTKTERLTDLLNGIDRPVTIKHTVLNPDLKSKVLYLHYQIYELVKLCGASLCYDVFKIFAGEDWDLYVSMKNLKLLELYNTMFVPVTVRTFNVVDTLKVVKYTSFTLSIMLKIHGAEITVPLNNSSVIIKGYFRDDPLNISRIGGTLELKNKELKRDARERFKELNNEQLLTNYISQITLRDFVSLDHLSLIYIMQNDFKEILTLKTKPKGHTIEEFLKAGIKKQYSTLTLLLLDPQLHGHALSVINTLSFYDKTMLNDLYKILHWSMQKVFDTINININESQIIETDNQALPYETRIENMKCSETIKKKAREKLKEIKSSREGNDKAVKYLDGLLRIPFNTYKKEKIVAFLSNFNKEIENIKSNVVDYLSDKTDDDLFKSILLNLNTTCSENEIGAKIAKLQLNYNELLNLNGDYAKELTEQIKVLLSKWTTFKIDRKKYLTDANTVLENCIYGQDEAKRTIETVLAQWINGEMSGVVLGFQGYPGTGKTSLAKHGIANCIKDENGNSRPFFFISLGGAKGGSTLLGHSYTYVGSQPGKLVECVQTAKVLNPIFYFDELDKVSSSSCGEEIIRILTHLTDPEQNDHIEDRYFNVEFDLSKALIIFSYNNSNKIDEILLDRIHEVKFKQYNKKDKVHISLKYVLPKIFKSLGYSLDSIIFSEEILSYIIENYTIEAGVRDMKDKLLEIVREVNLRRIYNEDLYVLPFQITEEFVDEILKRKNKITITEIPPTSQVGWVNGLYATSVGTGGITVIQVFNTPSDQKYHLELTGKLGDVMKESVRCAKTISWNMFSDDKKAKVNDFWRENALHIHFPAAGTSKDGPSAGAAITTAIISYLSKLPVRNYIAMTGEIDLYGNIRPIGGLQCKIEGAQRAGVKLILIPRDNEVEYLEFASEYKISVFAVDNISQIIRVSLINADKFQFNYSHDVNDHVTIKILEKILELDAF